MPTKQITASRILNAALESADKRGWENVHLYKLADTLDISLVDIKKHYPDKDAMVEAWFEVADRAMLKYASRKELIGMPAEEILHQLIMAWLTVLGVHQEVTREMVLSKFAPGRIKLQIFAVFRIQQTVRWLFESCRRDKVFVGRMLEEAGLTAIFIATFLHWLNDNSENYESTSLYLERAFVHAATLQQFTREWVPMGKYLV